MNDDFSTFVIGLIFAVLLTLFLGFIIAFIWTWNTLLLQIGLTAALVLGTFVVLTKMYARGSR
jgi:hypothetical protein